MRMKKRKIMRRSRGVQIIQPWSTVNKSWSTAIFGDRGSIIPMNIVTR